MNEQDRLQHFWGKVQAAKKSLLMLDYDGTLSPFRKERDQAIPYPGVRELIARIALFPHTRVVVISGRKISEIEKLLGLDVQVEIWGCHGLERLRPGEKQPEKKSVPESVKQKLLEIENKLIEENLAPYLERKDASVGVHWRGLDNREEIEKKAIQIFSQLMTKEILEVLPFDGGMEVRSIQHHKGIVVKKLLAEEGEGVAAAFLGDDLTDEDAFAVLQGKGLNVLVRPEKRVSAADVWIKPPQGLLSFLEKWEGCLSGQ